MAKWESHHELQEQQYLAGLLSETWALMWYAGQEGSKAKKCASVPVDCQTWIKRSRHNAKQVKVQDGVATTSSLSVELPKEKVGKEEADSVERKSCQSMYGDYLYY